MSKSKKSSNSNPAPVSQIVVEKRTRSKRQATPSMYIENPAPAATIAKNTQELEITEATSSSTISTSTIRIRMKDKYLIPKEEKKHR